LEPLIRLLRRWWESLEQLAFTAFNIFLALFVALIVLVAAAALGVGVLKELSGQELSADLGAPHFEAQIALMLLIVACLDLGLTAFLGTFVLTEFIRSRGRPRLALGFVDPWTGMGYSRLPLRIAAGDQQSVAFDVAIRNEGNTSAVWYMFELETPFRAR